MKLFNLRHFSVSLLALLALSVGVVHQVEAKQQKPVKAKSASLSAQHKKSVQHRHLLVKTSGKTAGKKLTVKSTKPAKRSYVMPVVEKSFGAKAGLHQEADSLALRSSVALVVDQDTHEVLLSKNAGAVLPIASITKLMTGVVISEAHLPMDEEIVITADDVDTEKRSSSRLDVGTQLTRRELLHLALMASENRAAHALGRTFPGGMERFVSLMNLKARFLDMKDTRYVEPTGLNSNNQSSAKDLATLVNYASNNPLLSEFSTSTSYEVEVGRRTVQFNNTNRLVKNPTWDIGLQKTGYIVEAGQCLVMQAKVAGRKLIMVFLDSAGKLSRIADAERVRRWVQSGAARALEHPPISWAPQPVKSLSEG